MPVTTLPPHYSPIAQNRKPKAAARAYEVETTRDEHFLTGMRITHVPSALTVYWTPRQTQNRHLSYSQAYELLMGRLRREMEIKGFTFLPPQSAFLKTPRSKK